MLKSAPSLEACPKDRRSYPAQVNIKLLSLLPQIATTESLIRPLAWRIEDFNEQDHFYHVNCRLYFDCTGAMGLKKPTSHSPNPYQRSTQAGFCFVEGRGRKGVSLPLKGRTMQLRASGIQSLGSQIFVFYYFSLVIYCLFVIMCPSVWIYFMPGCNRFSSSEILNKFNQIEP